MRIWSPGIPCTTTSLTEGEGKPLKYPLAFNTSAVALVTKADLADAVGYDRDASHRAIASVAPLARILEISCRTGQGLDAWYALVEERLSAKRPIVSARA